MDIFLLLGAGLLLALRIRPLKENIYDLYLFAKVTFFLVGDLFSFRKRFNLEEAETSSDRISSRLFFFTLSNKTSLGLPRSFCSNSFLGGVLGFRYEVFVERVLL